VCNGGIRLGLYDPIKGLMSADGSGRDLHVGQKLAAGSISGGIGAMLTTPIELAKTRLQVGAGYSSAAGFWTLGLGVWGVAHGDVAWRGCTCLL
jgi:hypothetical protein